MAEYLRPATLSSALEALNGTPWSVLAGGTDFYPARVVRVLDEDVLDISALRELRSIEKEQLEKFDSNSTRRKAQPR